MKNRDSENVEGKVKREEERETETD